MKCNVHSSVVGYVCGVSLKRPKRGALLSIAMDGEWHVQMSGTVSKEDFAVLEASLFPHVLGLIHAPVLDRARCDSGQCCSSKCCYTCTQKYLQGIAPCQTLSALRVGTHLQRRGSTQCKGRGKGLHTGGCQTQANGGAKQDAPHGRFTNLVCRIKCGKGKASARKFPP
jgi:hypothetical protein